MSARRSFGRIALGTGCGLLFAGLAWLAGSPPRGTAAPLMGHGHACPSEVGPCADCPEEWAGTWYWLRSPEQEHRVIANAGEALKELLAEILEDAMVSRADVEMAAATYLVYYDAHITREEDDVIARAGRVLTAEDWAAVKDAVSPTKDPVFGDAPEERYRKLRRQIALEA